jgi:2-C-methyl-D-erythritol 4-phosphate cytidylyltransferase
MATSDDRFWCVVPAAGRSTRIGGDCPKQYLPIAGKPMLLRTLERLATHPRIGGLMVVLAATDTLWPGLEAIAGKPVLTCVGGEERADSVLAGLNGLRTHVADEQFVLVHDAARPLVSAGDISRLIELGAPAGGGLLAIPLRDTLKRAQAGNRVVATEAREERWRALTPQMFRYGELVSALQAARTSGIAVTDEAMAMERAGHSPLLVEGAESNIKVTTSADLLLAEFLIDRTAGRD